MHSPQLGHRSKTILLAFVALINLFGFIALASAEPPKQTLGKVTTKLDAFEVGRYQGCGADSECVKANNGCCDCANGGEDVAVNKSRLKDFQARFDCMEIMCTEMAAEPGCGTGVVSCMNHKCKYVPLAAFGR